MTSRPDTEQSTSRRTSVREGSAFLLSPVTRRWWLTAHIIVSVGLLGDSAGFLAVAIRGVTTSDPALADSAWQFLEMFAFVFGIPLSVATLITGLVLGLSSKWGVFRYPWVITKLALVLSVMIVGTVVLPDLTVLRSGGTGVDERLIGGAAYDVVALGVATGLAVFKPGGRRNSPRRRHIGDTRAPRGTPAPGQESR